MTCESSTREPNATLNETISESTADIDITSTLICYLNDNESTGTPQLLFIKHGIERATSSSKE